MGLQSGQQALTRIAVILAAKGGPVDAVRVGDCVELLEVAASVRATPEVHAQQPAVLPAAARARCPERRCAHRD